MTAVQVARKFAQKIAKDAGVKMYPADRYGPRVRNAHEAAEHGWTQNALATVTFEGFDLVPYTLTGEFTTDGFFIEAENSFIVGVYR